MTHSTLNILKAAALVACLALPGAALASSDDIAIPTETRASITAVVEGQGYQLLTIETERGGYEVKAMRDGRLWELRLNAAFEITRTELED